MGRLHQYREQKKRAAEGRRKNGHHGNGRKQIAHETLSALIRFEKRRT